MPREWHAGSGLAWATFYLAVFFWFFSPILMGGCRSVDRSSSAMVCWPTQRQTEQQSNEAPAFAIDASVHAHILIDVLICSVVITVATREGRDV